MAPAADIQTIKANNPDFVIPGIDSDVGVRTPDADLRSFRSLTAADGIYYNAALDVVVVTKDGTDLSGIDFRGTSVMVQADNVSISDSRFDAASGPFAIKVYAGYSNFTLDQSTFDGLKLNRNYSDFIISEGINTAIRNSEFLNAPADAIYIENGTVTGNVIAGGGYLSGAHADAIWIGKTTGTVTINGNLIDWRSSPDAAIETNNAIRITAEVGDVSNVLVRDNVVLGGRYSVLVTNGPTETHENVGSVTDVSFIHNIVDWAEFGPLKNENVSDGFVYTQNQNAAGLGVAVGGAANLPFNALNGFDGSALADALHGSSQSDYIAGGDGSDWISAADGSDIIRGGAGRDYLIGGAGADHFMFASIAEAGTGVGRDLITDFERGVDKVYLAGLADLPAELAGIPWRWLGTERFSGNPLEVHYYWGSTNTIMAVDIDGDMQADLEVEFSGHLSLTNTDLRITSTLPNTASDAPLIFDPEPVIAGTDGNDALGGTDNGEEIFGFAGADVIDGGAGNDVLVGGPGRDLMSGGAGQDRFVFEIIADSVVGGANRDIIQDFVPGEDVLDLTRLDADTATPALDAFSWIGLSNFSGAPGQIRYQQVGAYVVVQADLNGDKAADLEIGLAGNFELTRSALLFPGRVDGPVNQAPSAAAAAGTGTASDWHLA